MNSSMTNGKGLRLLDAVGRSLAKDRAKHVPGEWIAMVVKLVCLDRR